MAIIFEVFKWFKIFLKNQISSVLSFCCFFLFFLNVRTSWLVVMVKTPIIVRTYTNYIINYKLFDNITSRKEI